MILRKNCMKDQPQLVQLWKKVFGDPDDYIQMFQCYYGKPGDAMLLEQAGKILSAIYTIPLEGVCFPGGEIGTASLTYGLATDPNYRGKGFGRRVMNAAVAETFSHGYQYSALWPAEDSLFSHYTEASGYIDCFVVREATVGKPAEGPKTRVIREASPKLYNSFRNRFLGEWGGLYLQFGESALCFQKEMSRLSGGDCYLLGIKQPWGCAVCERVSTETVAVKELLCSEAQMETALGQISAVLPAREYMIRTPAPFGLTFGGTIRRCGQMQAKSGCRPLHAAEYGYYGPAFD